jgi:hydroxymethylglutaryl-CoA reductase
MVLIGAGQGLAFAPMTSAGLSGVGRADAGTAAVPAGAPAPAALTDRVSTALTAGSLLLAAALAATVALIARRRPERRTAGSAPAADVRAAHVSGSR